METASFVFKALENEMALYEELAVALAGAREGLSRMSVDGIYQAISVQEQVVLRLSEIEKDRDRAVKKLSRELGSPSPMTLSGIIKTVSEPWRTRFSDVSARLNAVLQRVETEKRMNLDIINKALAHVEESLYILGGAASCSEGYGALGAPAQDGQPSGLLSTKV